MTKAAFIWRWKAERNIPCYTYLAIIVPSFCLLLEFLPRMLQAKQVCDNLKICLYQFICIYYYLKKRQAKRQVGPLKTSRKTLLGYLSNELNKNAVLTEVNTSKRKKKSKIRIHEIKNQLLCWGLCNFQKSLNLDIER